MSAEAEPNPMQNCKIYTGDRGKFVENYIGDRGKTHGKLYWQQRRIL